ncbi:TetR/AcrR family transcriptional regulator [Patulibacter minatonensis]|uniref:TetR/AcrR family transcriptional regulator n=1 Tax=Patulibacter minatonensis TaxID=298163 RepID=UPI000684487A|nr:TetR/AcrR family transcriptional regulator [Patulibacter minatonensis]
MPEPTETRRDRVRRQTLDEIKRHALDQLADGGPQALSLNAIGKAMGMSGPAVYRYFASRDAVLAALIIDGYGDLTRTLEEAASAAARRRPARRLLAIGDAYRDWALRHRHLYGLLFGLRPEGYGDPDEALAAIQGSMVVLLEAIGAVAAEGGVVGGEASVPGGGAAEAPGAPTARRGGRVAAAAGPGGQLDVELRRWAAARAATGGTATDAPGATDAQAPPDVAVLRLGVLAWTRIHGVVGLEFSGALGDMGLDAGLLIGAEVEGIAALARGAR